MSAFRLLLLASAVAIFVGAFRQSDDRGASNGASSITTGSLSAWATLQQDATKGTKILSLEWRKGGFDSVMVIDKVTIKNTGSHLVKDIGLKCNIYAPSGTQLGAPSVVIYEKLPAGKTKTFRNLTAGFINNQAASASCGIAAVEVDLMQ